MRTLGSIQEAFRLEKLVPTNGALPSGAMTNGTGPGPWDNRNAGRGSPTGDCTAGDARYTTKLNPRHSNNTYCVIWLKMPRKTSFGLITQDLFMINSGQNFEEYLASAAVQSP